VSQSQDDLYKQTTEMYGEALDRLVRAYELDADKRRDLLQEIHLALWRSFEQFEARCSVRTWMYRVAHNTAASYVMRQRRSNSRLLSLEDLDTMPESAVPSGPDSNDRMALQRLLDLGLQFLRIGFVVGIEIGADRRGDREAGRHRQAEIRHLGEICALASEEIAKLRFTLGPAVAEGKDPLAGFHCGRRALASLVC